MAEDYRRSSSYYSRSPQQQGYAPPKDTNNSYGGGESGRAHQGGGGNYGYGVNEGYGGNPNPPAPSSASQADSYAPYQKMQYYQMQQTHLQQEQHPQQTHPQHQDAMAAAYYASQYYASPGNAGGVGADMGGRTGAGGYSPPYGYYPPSRGGRGWRGANNGGYHSTSRYGQGGGAGDDYYQMGGGPSRPYGYRGGGGRGGAGFRGGRGGGYPGPRPYQPRVEHHCIIYVDSFATLHSACRRGETTSLFPRQLVAQAANGTLGGGGSPRYPQGGNLYHQQSPPYRPPVILRALVVVEKQYLVACISEPKEEQNIVLSESIARKFLNMKHILNENSQPLLQLESGGKLPKSLYHQLRAGLVQLLSLDKSEAASGNSVGGEEAAKDSLTDPNAEQEMAELVSNPSLIFDVGTDKVLKYLLSRYSVFTAVENCLKEESERSTALFGRLIEQSCNWIPRKTGANATAQNDDEGEEEEGDEDEPASRQGTTAEDGSSSTTPSATPLSTADGTTFRRRAHPLLRTPHGVYLLQLALESPGKRGLFFRRMQEEQEQIAQAPYHTAPEGTLFVVFFASILTCSLVFKCFGLSLGGDLPAEECWPDQETVTQILCDRMANEGIVLVRSTGGGAVLTALLHAQRPQYSYLHPPGAPYRRKEGGAAGSGNVAHGEGTASTFGGSGGARKRGREDGEEQRDANGVPSYKLSASRKEFTDGTTAQPGGEGAARPEEEGVASRRGIKIAPTSLEAYEVPPPPKDWRFLEATVEAFCTGRIPERIPNPQAVSTQGGAGYGRGGRGRGRGRGAGAGGDMGADGSNAGANPAEPAYLPVTLTAKEVSLDNRIPLLTDHVISCRALQTMLPPMADVILAYEKEEQAKRSSFSSAWAASSEVPPFVQKCTDFLASIIKRGKELMVQPFGNYVAQTFLSELSHRAIPGSRVESLVKDLLQLMQDSFLDFCLDKCASNVLDRAIVATESMPHEGYSFLLQGLRALVQCPDTQMVNVVSNQYGNYVVIHLLQHIDDLLQLTASGSSMVEQRAKPLSVVQEEARQLEKQFLDKVYRHLPQLQSSRFAFGLLKWVEAYQR